MSSAAGVFPQTVQAAADDLVDGLFPEWTPVALADARAMVSYRINADEHQRRAAAGVGALTSPDLLRLLISLPLGERVGPGVLTAAERRRLRGAGAGIIAPDGAGLVRLATLPLEAGLALVTVASWRRGLELAGRFTPFCARAMVLPQIPAEVEALRMEADFYGIGVIIDEHGEDPAVLVPPAPFVRKRFSVGGWLFAEQMYRQISSAR